MTAEQLRDRSWWRGPEMVVVIDDYDMVATSAGNRLMPLVEILPYGREVGLHVIVARRTGGAGRALFDPMLQRLADLATSPPSTPTPDIPKTSTSSAAYAATSVANWPSMPG